MQKEAKITIVLDGKLYGTTATITGAASTTKEQIEKWLRERVNNLVDRMIVEGALNDK